MVDLNKKSYVAGHTGLVGSAILRRLKKDGYKNIITATRKKLNLTKQTDVINFLKKKKPDFIFIAAAKVGGILSNSKNKADFITENLQIQTNLIHGAFLSGINKLIFLGSSCVYPRHSKQPIKEKYLLTGELEETNDAYAIAKIAGIKMCEAYNKQYKTNYKCLMPTNTYGPNDNYNLMTSHFFPALIHKAHMCKVKNKKSIEVWGSGKVYREMIFVDDIADACVFFMKKKIKHSLINIGSGKDMTILNYVKFILKKLDLDIKINFIKSKPDGVYKKLLDVKIAKKYGWIAKTSLSEGFDITYKSFLKKNK